MLKDGPITWLKHINRSMIQPLTRERISHGGLRGLLLCCNWPVFGQPNSQTSFLVNRSVIRPPKLVTGRISVTTLKSFGGTLRLLDALWRVILAMTTLFAATHRQAMCGDNIPLDTRKGRLGALLYAFSRGNN